MGHPVYLFSINASANCYSLFVLLIYCVWLVASFEHILHVGVKH